MTLLADPVRLRRSVIGAAFIGCPLAGVVSSLFDADEGSGTNGHDIYRIAVAHHRGIWVAGLIFLLSAVLTVPIAAGVLHLTRSRGTVLGHLGAAFLVLGAFGHMGYGTWQLMVARAPSAGPHAGAVGAYFDRASAVTNVLLPLLFCIVIGLILGAFAMRRAAFIPGWVPALVVVAAVFDVVTDSMSKWTPVATWGMVLVALAYVGVKVLRTPDSAWETTAASTGARSTSQISQQAAAASVS